jgi:hypothetical protein
MKVTVKLPVVLAHHFPGCHPENGIVLNLPERSKVRDLFALLEISRSEGYTALADGVVLKFDSPLRKGMCVKVLPLASGG